MLIERYAVKPKETINLTNIFDINIEDGLFETINIENSSYEMFIHQTSHSIDNASFDNLIVIFTKPEIIYNNGRDLYKLKIAYVKTKNDQLIVNVQDWNVVNHLNEFQGLIDFVNLYIMPYDNIAKIAVEYKYHSIPNSILYQTIQKILINGFIRFGINYEEDLDLVQDYLQSDFESTFNHSRRNKKIVVHLDTINNNTETINSAKIEYSIKSDITFENTFNYLRSHLQDNIQRYSIKCEDENSKTASIDGYGEDLRTSEWSKPARIKATFTYLD